MNKKDFVMKNTLINITLVLFLAACSCPTVDNSPAPEPEPVQETHSYKWNNKEWTKILTSAIKTSKLTGMPVSDWQEFNFDKKMGTVNEWARVFVEMSYWESKFKPNSSYKENFRDSQGNIIYSRGLFMLSRESGRGYGCPFNTQNDLFDPKKNIECAVKIMETWVIRDGKIHTDRSPYRGGARYWAVLRGNRDYTRKSLKAIKDANK